MLPSWGEVRPMELPGWREVWPVEPPRWRGGETEGPRRRPPPGTGLEVSGGRLTFSLLLQPWLQVEFDLPPDSIRDALEVGFVSAAIMFFCYKLIRRNHKVDGPSTLDTLAGGGGGTPGPSGGGVAHGPSGGGVAHGPSGGGVAHGGGGGGGGGRPPVDDAPGVGGGGALF